MTPAGTAISPDGASGEPHPRRPAGSDHAREEASEAVGVEPARPEGLGEPGVVGSGSAGDSVTIPVERGGRTRLVERADISVVESEGDYVRLHIGEASYLVRISLGKLEQEWAAAGFIRVHRSFLVNVHHLDELRTEASGVLVARVAGRDVPVSRRGQRTVREFLATAARLGGLSSSPRPPDGPRLPARQTPDGVGLPVRHTPNGRSG